MQFNAVWQPHKYAVSAHGHGQLGHVQSQNLAEIQLGNCTLCYYKTSSKARHHCLTEVSHDNCLYASSMQIVKACNKAKPSLQQTVKIFFFSIKPF